MRKAARALFTLAVLCAPLLVAKASNNNLSFAEADSEANSDITTKPVEQAEIPPSFCPAGGPLGDVELLVESSRGESPLPLRTINRLSEGDQVLYQPVLRGKAKRHGEVALVLVPSAHPGQRELVVTDPKSAAQPQHWTIESTAAIAAFVYGPEGINGKKVKNFLSQDDRLIAQLADYAEKTAQTEQLIAALESNESSAATVNAALNGFASQYGLGVQIDKSAPPNQQAQVLFQTLNPALASYDPLQPSASARFGQTASVATAVATLFFGSPVGLAAGGTAMLLDLKALAFPGTQFRTSFAIPLPDQTLNLCGRRDPAPPHTKVAYIWAIRVPNTRPPTIKIQKTDYLPIGEKSTLPVEVPDPQWKYLERSRGWTLDRDKSSVGIPVIKLANQRSLELDLTKANLVAGDYKLSGFWDWQRFTTEGVIHVRSFSDLTKARVEPVSQDKLIAKSGKVVATLTGVDFEFINKVQIKKVGDEFAAPAPIPFKLTKGIREGEQDTMDVQINTADLDTGEYQLLLQQQDNKAQPVGVKVLSSPARITNLPLTINQGVPVQTYELTGTNLDLISKIEVSGATVTLGPADPDKRKVEIRMLGAHDPGTSSDMKVYIRDRNEPLTFNNALQISGPLPVITGSTISAPGGMAVALRDGEIPAGYNLSTMLKVQNIQSSSMLAVSCEADSNPRLTLRIGEQNPVARLQQLAPDQLFLSADTSSWPAGCIAMATLSNGDSEIHAQPFNLGKVIRLPQLDSTKLTGEDAGDGTHVVQITGRNLETIEKVGWDGNAGMSVLGLPAPILGQGQEQLLRAKLPPPPASSTTLYIWLRGEQAPRQTTVAVGKLQS